MNTEHDPPSNLPVKGSLVWIYAFSFLVAILITVASVAGLLFRADIYPTEAIVQSFVPNDVVNLSIGLPILLGSMWLARRGKLIGLLCWVGALFFVFYNYLAYVLAMPFNWAFLLHLVLVALSVYALIGLVVDINGNAVQQKLSGVVPERFAGGVLAGLGLLFLLRVIGVLIGALINQAALPKTELAVNISDFIITPAWIIGGILLWRRKPLGYVTGLGLLFQGSMLFIALIIFLFIQPVITNASFAAVDVIVIFVMGSVCFIPFVLFARGVMTSPRHYPNKR